MAAGDVICIFKLYVAGHAPNSRRAIKNLNVICHEYLNDRVQLEIVDILEEPHKAISEGVFVTPALVKVSPSPPCKLTGDLSETGKVIEMLGLEEVRIE